MKFGLILWGIYIVLLPVVQILEKQGMKQVGQLNNFGEMFSFHTLWRVATNPYIICGVLLSAVLLTLWLGALSTLDISYMFPLASIAYIILALLASIFLKEEITATRWVGIGVIAFGCYLINK